MDRMTLGAFARQIEAQVWEGRVPVDGTLELTRRCPFRCGHCYLADPAPEWELDADEWLRVIGAVADAGCLWLTLTGGEPLSRPDFPRLCRAAVSKGLLVTVFTNGFLADEPYRDLLAELSVRRVEVSVYGSCEATYRRVTGVAGAWAKVRRNVEAMVGRGVPVALKTVATRETAPDIPAIAAWAAGLGVPFRFDPALNPRLRRPGTLAAPNDLRPLDARLVPEEAIRLEERFPDRVEAWKEACSLRLPAPHAPAPAGLDCGAGLVSFHVTPEGVLTPCLLLPWLGVSLRDEPFDTAWAKSLAAQLAGLPSADPECDLCPHAMACDHCPAWAFLEKGRWDGKSDYLCRLTRLRHRAFGEVCV